MRQPRIGLALFLTGICALLLAIAPASYASLSHEFKIHPYLHFGNNQNIFLSWQYKGDYVRHMQLPMDTCGFGKKSFQLKGMKQTQMIKEIPCPQSNSITRFTFLADTQEGSETNTRFTELIESFDSQAVIYGGDIVQTADDDDDWQTILDSTKLSNMHRVMIPVVGNHEYRGDKKAESWEKYFNFPANEAFYSVWVGPVKMIILSSNFEDDASMIEKQLPWLDEELKKPAPWKVVIFHHPPFSRSVMYQPIYWRKEYEPLRQFYLPLFEKYKVDVVLNGHSHLYERSFKDGIHYVTTGAAGGKSGLVAAENPYVKMLVETRTIIQCEATLDALRLTAVTLDNIPIDDLILKK